MSVYRRVYQPGGCYFFTLVTHGRRPILTRPENIHRLRAAFRHVAVTRPFEMQAIVVLPDHLHCLWRLPEDDKDFSIRWRLVKRYFSVGLEAGVNGRREKNVWQRRYWEHCIRDEGDWRCHMDYVHYNPVRHGLVAAPNDWPHSSFRRAVERGWYEPNWGRSEPAEIAGMEFE